MSTTRSEPIPEFEEAREEAIRTLAEMKPGPERERFKASVYHLIYGSARRVICEGPNSQQISKNTDEIQEIKDAFLKKYPLVAMDFGDIETRIVGTVTGRSSARGPQVSPSPKVGRDD